MRSDQSPSPIGPAEAVLLPAATVVAAVVLWWLAVAVSGTRIFPSPARSARAVYTLVESGRLWRHVGASLFRVAVGYLIGVGLGTPLGLLLGWSEGTAAAINPLVQILRPISALAWIPIAIALFGIGNRAAIFLVSLAAFFPMVVTTMNAVRNVPPVYTAAGRNFGLSRPALLARVVLPAVVPEIVIGLRLSLGVAWLVIVAAEMLGLESGLGYLVFDARNAGQRYDLVVGTIVMIGAIGLLLDAGIRRLEWLRAVRWGLRTI